MYCLVDVIFSRLVTSVGEGRELFFCCRLLVLLKFLVEVVPVPLAAEERLHYFIAKLPVSFI